GGGGGRGEAGEASETSQRSSYDNRRRARGNVRSAAPGNVQALVERAVTWSLARSWIARSLGEGGCVGDQLSRSPLLSYARSPAFSRRSAIARRARAIGAPLAR